jgi:hypothetical protein
MRLVITRLNAARGNPYRHPPSSQVYASRAYSQSLCTRRIQRFTKTAKVRAKDVVLSVEALLQHVEVVDVLPVAIGLNQTSLHHVGQRPQVLSLLQVP